MEAFEIESQTDQAPLASYGCYPTQRELAETQYLFDDPHHGFDGAFACSVDRFTQGGLELVRHFHLGARVLRWWIGSRSKTLLPARMMGITPRCDGRLDAALVAGPKEPASLRVYRWLRGWVRLLGYRWGDCKEQIPR